MSYTDKYGVEFSDDKERLIECPKEFKGEYIIPNSVTSIGWSAFSGCTGLTSIEIPSSVTKIERSAFGGCTGLVSILVDKDNKVYDSRDSCNAIIETASNKLIYGIKCTNIPNSVTVIGEIAFSSCRNLTSIEIPNSVTEIGRMAFGRCTGLTSIDIPSSVTYIGEDAFRGCTGLTSIKIPNSVTKIGSRAFCLCTGLTSIEIPDSVSVIGSNPFYGCTGLTSILVDKKNKVYDTRDYCNAIIETTSNKLICGCRCTTIPNSVTVIHDTAFADCTCLTSIKIPNSVTEIGHNTFAGCTRLTSIEIPDSVTNIGQSAFSGCTGLTSIKIPNSVTWIRDNTFERCTGLTSVDIPSSVTGIGPHAFERCTRLTSIDIPGSVTYIGVRAFMECTGLTSIELPSSITSIDNAYSYCMNLKSLIFKYVSGNEDLSINYFFDRIIIKYVTISDGITSIPDNMFSGAESLEMVYLSNTLTALPDKTFYNCKNLEELNIPNSVKRIGDDCIVGCGLLKTLVIPEGVETSGDRAICDCEGLESVTLPSTIKRIGTGFLSGCPNLKQVIIPSGSKLKFFQLGLDNLKNKLVERGTGARSGNFAPKGDVDEINMLFTLGKAYELGIGVGKNILQAVMMYTQAAGKGHAEAAYRIAEMYRKGEGLPQNMDSAIQYYRIAANSNFLDSVSIVRDYEESLRKEEQKRVEAQKRAEERARMEERRLQPYYLFFDTETTGLPARYDAPCSDTYNWPRMVQLSWIVTDRNGTVIRKSDNIIKPVGFTIPADASNLHGITTSKALSEGKDLRTVVGQFMGELANVSYVVGHNVEFDTNIVGAELCRLGMFGSDLLYKQSICTMKSTIDYCQIPPFRYGSYKFPKLQELHKKLFGYEFDDAHNSMCDVEATMKCFFELVNRSIIN